MNTIIKLFALIFILIILLFFSCNRTKNNEVQSDEMDVVYVVEGNYLSIERIKIEEPMTHYVIYDLNLMAESNLSSVVISVLPSFSALRIIETGETEIINGITTQWIKIMSQTGYIGWVFSADVGVIDSNVTRTLALSFTGWHHGSFLGERNIPDEGNIISFEDVLSATGYYIQQTIRRFQGRGRSPEILKLSVEGENVYIREIDLIGGQKIIRNEILLEFNGTTFIHNRAELQTQNGIIQIIYFENAPAPLRWMRFDDEAPFTFAGNLTDPIPYLVRRLTSDYLKTFVGRYIFDSYYVIKSKNIAIENILIPDVFIQITYDQERKLLMMDNSVILSHQSIFVTLNYGFIETIPEEPFYWSYAEGRGFVELRKFFFKGGIAFTFEYSGFNFDNNNEHEYIKGVVFFRREI